MSICFIDGAFRPTEECRLPVTDMVIQRGVGVFDSIRLYDRKAFALSEHLERLKESAKGAGIRVDGIVERMFDTIREGARRDDCPNEGNCLVKPYITGGDVNDCGRFPEPRHFVIFEEGPPICAEEYKTGVALQPTSVERLHPLVKSTNYLFGLMQSAGMSDVLECLYCPGGEVTETLRSSFFACLGGKIVTAPIGRVLGGITRNIVLKLARENGFTVEERCPLLTELPSANEAFITSTWKEVMPVVRVGDVRINQGKPGPVAAHLQKLFRASFDEWLDR